MAPTGGGRGPGLGFWPGLLVSTTGNAPRITGTRTTSQSFQPASLEWALLGLGASTGPHLDKRKLSSLSH